MKFTGYGPKWNVCECGQTLLKVGDVLRHRPNRLKAHHLVMRKKAEKQNRICVICLGPIGVDPNGWDGGHNAYPMASGLCCFPCNRDLVTPARLMRLGMTATQKQLEEMSK